MQQINAKILSNLQIGPYHYKMVLGIPHLDEKLKPGQFINIKITDFFDPFLRRPFSIHRIGPRQKVIEVLYKVVGRATALLSRRSRGTFLDIIIPLGNGFVVGKDISTFLLIAGGMGVAPLVALADEIAENRKNRLYVILGAKTKEQILCKDEFKALGAEIEVVTEDGSQGAKGTAVDLFLKRLKRINPALARKGGIKPSLVIADARPNISVFACGPVGMLKEISQIVKRERINCQASFEEHLACGIGACMGCSILTVDGFKRVCCDGPVFDISRIVFR